MYAKVLKNIAGIILIGTGIAGIFLPIVPGILLIIAGLFLMEIRIEYIKKWVKKLKF